MGDQKFVEGQLAIMNKFDQKSGMAWAGAEAGTAAGTGAGVGVRAGAGGELRGATAEVVG